MLCGVYCVQNKALQHTNGWRGVEKIVEIRDVYSQKY